MGGTENDSMLFAYRRKSVSEPQVAVLLHGVVLVPIEDNSAT